MTQLTEAVAATAAQLRAANHATVRAPITTTEVFHVVGHLDDLARRLPHLLDFLTRSLRRADVTGYVDDHGTDPARALRRADDHLQDARQGASELAEHLALVHSDLGRLAQVPEGDVEMDNRRTS